MTRRSPGRLLPREHGAYAQLATPLLAALVMCRPSPAALLLTIAATAAFLANEPLLVVLGHRGARARDADGARAVRLLVLTATVAALTGSSGLVLASSDARLIAAVVAFPATMMIALAWRRGQHSIAGELVAAVALPGAAAPVAVASGLPSHDAIAIWAAWSIGYASTVIAVHRVIARHHHAATWRDGIAALALMITAVAGVAIIYRQPSAAIGLPLVVIATVLAARPPNARRLRAIGVALVIASVVSGSIAVAVARHVLQEPSTSHAMGKTLFIRQGAVS